MPQGIEMIVTSFNVFLNYAYCFKISDFYLYFYQILKNGARFYRLFQSNISQRINKLQAPNLRQSNANYYAYHICKNCVIMITLNMPKHKTKMANFSRFKTLVYFNI